MADIAKIKLGSTDYDIKDTVARAQIITINDRIDRLDSRNFIVLGDSYGTGNQYNTGVTTSPTWVGYLKDYLGLSDSQWHTKSVDGCGFVAGYTFLQSLKDVEELISDKDSITDILVVGGYNDYSVSSTDILTAMSAFNTYAKTAFANAKISLACVGWDWHMHRYQIVGSVWTAYKQCSLYGWKYINFSEYIMHNYRNFATDHFHPNQDGQKALGFYLANGILTGSCDVNFEFSEAVIADANTALFNAGTFSIINGFDNGNVMVGWTDGSVTAASGINFSNGTEIILGTVRQPYTCMGAYYARYCSINTLVWIRYNNGAGSRFANCFGTMGFRFNASTHALNLVFIPFSHGYNTPADYNDVFNNVDIINWRGTTFVVPASSC